MLRPPGHSHCSSKKLRSNLWQTVWLLNNQAKHTRGVGFLVVLAPCILNWIHIFPRFNVCTLRLSPLSSPTSKDTSKSNRWDNNFQTCNLETWPNVKALLITLQGLINWWTAWINADQSVLHDSNTGIGIDSRISSIYAGIRIRTYVPFLGVDH